MIGILLIFLLILLCEISGYLILDKINVKTRYSIVFGFLLVVAFFEVVSFPFIILQTSFTLYRYVVWLLLIIFYFGLFKFLKFDKEKLIGWARTFDKTKIFVYVLVIIAGSYIALVSTSEFDSWLFMPMVLYPLQTNNITYSTQHALDGYYKMISLITYYSGNSVEAHYLFIMNFYKLFEMIIFINFLGFIAEQLFKKREKLTFLIFAIGLICQSVYLIFSNSELFTEIYMVSSNGTMFLEGVIIPFLFVYLYKDYKSNKLLLLILIAGLGFSSSMIYIYGTFLVLYLGYEIFINKKYSVRDLIIKLTLLVIPLYVLLEYVLIKSYANLGSILLYKLNVLSFLLVIFIFFIASKIIKKDMQCKKIFTFFLCSYILVIFVYLFFLILKGDIELHEFIRKIFSIQNKQKYGKGVYNIYLNALTPLYVIGLVLAYKNDKRLLKLHIVAVIFLANYIIYSTLGDIISQAVYHRVYIFASSYIFCVMSIVFLIDKILEKEYKINGRIIKKEKYIFMYVFVGLIFILTIYFQKEKLYKFDEPFIEYKLRSEDVLEILEFNFQTPNIEILINYEDFGNEDFAIEQIFQLNTELVNTYSCTNDCYILESRKVVEKSEGTQVYENENFVLKYIE